MLKHGYWYHSGYSGTGMGTMKWVWAPVRIPSHVETRVQVQVRVPQWVLGYEYGYQAMLKHGYGYHNGYLGTGTMKWGWYEYGYQAMLKHGYRYGYHNEHSVRVRVLILLLWYWYGYGYRYKYYMSLYIVVFLLNTVSQSTAFIMAQRFLLSSAMEILDNVHIYFTKEEINNAPLIDN